MQKKIIDEFQAKHQAGVTVSNIYKMAGMFTLYILMYSTDSTKACINIKKNHCSTLTALDMREIGYRQRRKQNNCSDEF